MTTPIERYVEDAHRALLLDNAQYRAYLAALYDEQAVEGSLEIDTFMAAGMIRDRVIELAIEQLAPIAEVLCVIIRQMPRTEDEIVHQALTYSLLGPTWFAARVARKFEDSRITPQELLDNCRTTLELALTRRALAAAEDRR